MFLTLLRFVPTRSLQCWLALLAMLLCTPALGQGTPITGLPTANALDGTEVAPFVQGGTTKKVTADQIATFAASTAREQLAADRTYYVRSDGSDSNDGLTNTFSGAYATPQKALNTILDTLDLAGYTATIKLADSGTFDPVLCAYPQTGPGIVRIEGDTGTPANTTIHADHEVAVDLRNGCVLYLKGFRITVEGDLGVENYNVRARSGAVVHVETGLDLGNNIDSDGGAGSGPQLVATDQGNIFCDGNYTVSASRFTQHWDANTNGIVRCTGVTVTITNSPTFSFWALASINASISAFANTYSGSVTSGAEYYVGQSGQIFAFADDYPGTGGTTAIGGQFNLSFSAIDVTTFTGTADNEIVRAHGTQGLVQDSVITIDDSGNIGLPEGAGLNFDSGDCIFAQSGNTLSTTGCTISAGSIAEPTLGTNTAGNYVAAVADGTGIDGSCSSETCTYTPTLDLTEITSPTWGSGASITHTFNASSGGTVTFSFNTGADPDPSITVVSDIMALTSPTAMELASPSVIVAGIIDLDGFVYLNSVTGTTTPLRFNDADNSNYIEFVAPDTITSNVTCTLQNDSTPLDNCVSGGGGLSDTDYGDVTVSGSGTVMTVDSVGGETFTTADAGADAFFGFDDSADAYENLTKAEAQAILGLQSSTTDNQIVRYDSTSGNQQGSPLTIADTTGIIQGPANFAIDFAGGTTNTFTCASGSCTIEGNTLRQVGRRTEVVYASQWNPTITNGASRNYTELATNDIISDTLKFDTSTQQFATFYWVPPQAWNAGTVTFRVRWRSENGTSSDTLVMGLACVAISNDDALDASLGTGQTSTDTWIANGDEHISPESSAITCGGSPAKGDTIVFKLQRNVASDDVDDAFIEAVEIFYSLDAANDS